MLRDPNIILAFDGNFIFYGRILQLVVEFFIFYCYSSHPTVKNTLHTVIYIFLKIYVCIQIHHKNVFNSVLHSFNLHAKKKKEKKTQCVHCKRGLASIFPWLYNAVGVSRNGREYFSP